MNTLNGLLINKAIVSILSGSTELETYVNGRIYPIYAPDETLYPFVVIKRMNVDVTYTKDSSIYDQVPVNVYCVSEDYKEGLDIANIVRKLLERINGTYSNINIDTTFLNSADEDFGIDGYVQILEFIIKCR